MGSNPLSRLRLYVSMVRYGNAHNQDFAREHYTFFTNMRKHLQRYGLADLQDLRVLDVGCGKAYWLTLLLHSCGAHTTGIDTEFVEPGFGLGKYWGILRNNGPERALRTLVWDIFYGPPYYRELGKACPFPLRFKDVDVRRVSVTELDFSDSTFDLVVSHEVFEHIGDLPTTLRLIRRVMKPDGITWIYIHNFASLSGGHHIAWKYPDTEPSAVVPPWDHLRANRYPEIPSWINRLRERDYREAFEAHFDIIDWFPTVREGAALLTPEIRAELAEYSEDELLNKGFVVVARPRKRMQQDRQRLQSAVKVDRAAGEGQEAK
jgi:SAM-dependent methyltransferase